MRIGFAFAATFLLAAASLVAQNPSKLQALYVSDSTEDGVWRVQDLNCDDDYNDAGEVELFYDESLGGIALGNNVGITVAKNGDVFLCDITQDYIVRLRDGDDDGFANTPGEAVIVFDGNPGMSVDGVELFAANDLEIDEDGVLWIAVANGGGGGVDAIVRLEDTDSDELFLSAGEASYYYQPAGPGVGDALPGDVKIGQDGNVYYLEISGTGFWAKGIYKLVDLNGSGDIDDPMNEVIPFFTPNLPMGASNQFFWGIQQDRDGAWYMADTLNELVYKVTDSNGNGVIDLGSEDLIWWANPGSSNAWMIDISPDGTVYVAEDQTPDRLLRLKDLDGSGTIDSTNESKEVYSDLISATEIRRPRSLAIGPVRAAYRGNGADVALTVLTNGLDLDDGSHRHCVNPGDLLTLGFESPDGSLNGRPFLLVAQFFSQGSPVTPILLSTDDPAPSVFLDLGLPLTVLLDGLSPIVFAPVLGASALNAVVPPFLHGTGQSVMLELIAEAPGFNAVGLGDAESHELFLR